MHKLSLTLELPSAIGRTETAALQAIVANCASLQRYELVVAEGEDAPGFELVEKAWVSGENPSVALPFGLPGRIPVVVDEHLEAILSHNAEVQEASPARRTKEE